MPAVLGLRFRLLPADTQTIPNVGYGVKGYGHTISPSCPPTTHGHAPSWPPTALSATLTGSARSARTRARAGPHEHAQPRARGLGTLARARPGRGLGTHPNPAHIICSGREHKNTGHLPGIGMTFGNLI